MPKPVAALPNGITLSGDQYVGTVLDTTFVSPTGQDFPCHTAADLNAALQNARSGDRILLDPNVEYVGNFRVRARLDDGGWIHITTIGFHQAHPPGTRVGPGDAADMARIASPNASQVLSFESGVPAANHVRIYGVEFGSNSNYMPSGYTPNVYYGYALISINGAWQSWDYQHVPDYIIFDRCYIHGDDTHDIQCGIQGNFSHCGVVDCYISEIHMKGTDTSAYGCFCTPGPIKLVNNHLEAAGENVIFGGSGQEANQHPADIEIRDNYFFKPLAWIEKTASSPVLYVVKNSFEIKDAQRVLFDHNIVENCWAAAQMGYACVLTVRSSQSGSGAVCDDITVTNNIWENVTSFVNSLGKDDQAGSAGYPNTKSAGDQARWFISNNLVTFFDPTIPGGARNTGFAVNGGLDRINKIQGFVKDVIYSHNTLVAHPNATPSWSAAWVSMPAPPAGFQPFPYVTDNIWLIDNVLSSYIGGDNGYTGIKGINTYFPNPPDSPEGPLDRVTGNVILETTPRNWGPGNLSTNQVTFANPDNGDYTLTSPDWTGTDGKLPGVNMDLLPGNEPGEPEQPPIPTPQGVAFQIECHAGIDEFGHPYAVAEVIPGSVQIE